MKIVFFGTPEFAAYSLEKILESECCEVAAVVTMPDKIAGRGHKLITSAVKDMALKHNLPVLQPEKLKSPEFISQLLELKAHLFVVIAFRMLPQAVWGMPPKGTFNLHASLLPAYRGAAPINWAIINGEKSTGVTTFFLQHDIDTGDIIAQEAVRIEENDNAGTLHDKLMTLGAQLTVKTIQDIAEKGEVPTCKQQEKGEELKPAPKIFTSTCRIDWNQDARSIHNLVRGLSPYPAAWCESNMGNVKIFETRILPPGENSNKKLIKQCGEGCIEILSLQLQGKRRMGARDFLNGVKEPLELR